MSLTTTTKELYNREIRYITLPSIVDYRQLNEEFSSCIQKNICDVILNLSQVSNIDDSAAKFLLSATKKLQQKGGNLKLVALSKQVKHMFKSWSIETIFYIYDDDQQALKCIDIAETLLRRSEVLSILGSVLTRKDKILELIEKIARTSLLYVNYDLVNTIPKNLEYLHEVIHQIWHKLILNTGSFDRNPQHALTLKRIGDMLNELGRTVWEHDMYVWPQISTESKLLLQELIREILEENQRACIKLTSQILRQKRCVLYQWLEETILQLLPKIVPDLVSTLQDENGNIGILGQRLLECLESRVVPALLDAKKTNNTTVKTAEKILHAIIPGNHDLPSLMRTLEHIDLQVAEIATKILPKFGTTSFKLLLPLLGHEHWYVREAASQTLANLGDGIIADLVRLLERLPRKISDCFKFVRNKPNPAYTPEAKAIFAVLARMDSTIVLKQLFKHPPKMSAAFLQYLDSLDPKCAQPIIELLLRFYSPSLAVIQSITRFGSDSAAALATILSKTLSQHAMEKVCSMDLDFDGYERFDISSKIVCHSHLSTRFSSIRQVYEIYPDVKITKYELGCDDCAVVELLEPVSYHTQNEVDEVVIFCANECKYVVLVNFSMTQLAHGVLHLIQKIRKRLRKTGGDIKLVVSEDNVREDVFTYFHDFEVYPTKEEAVYCCQYSSWRATYFACQGLGSLGISDDQALTALTNALEHRYVRVAAGAADALGKIGVANVEVVGALIKAGKREERIMYIKSFAALADMGPNLLCVFRQFRVQASEEELLIMMQALRYIKFPAEHLDELLAVFPKKDASHNRALLDVLYAMEIPKLSLLVHSLLHHSRYMAGNLCVSYGRVLLSSIAKVNMATVIKIVAAMRMVITHIGKVAHTLTQNIAKQAKHKEIAELCFDLYCFPYSEVGFIEQAGQKLLDIAPGIGRNLAAALHHQKWQVRYMAVEIIAKLSTKLADAQILPALRCVLEDENPLVVKTAVTALALRNNSKPTQNLLIYLLQHPQLFPLAAHALSMMGKKVLPILIREIISNIYHNRVIERQHSLILEILSQIDEQAVSICISMCNQQAINACSLRDICGSEKAGLYWFVYDVIQKLTEKNA